MPVLTTAGSTKMIEQSVMNSIVHWVAKNYQSYQYLKNKKKTKKKTQL